MTTLQERMQELVRDTGWTVGEISTKAEVSHSAVSQWLSGETHSLKIEPAVLLERYTGFSALWLAKGKGKKKVDAAGANDDPEFAGRARQARYVPVVGTAKMGDDGYYEEISSVVGAGDGHIEIATEDPNAYGLRVRGQSMFRQSGTAGMYWSSQTARRRPANTCCLSSGTGEKWSKNSWCDAPPQSRF